MFDFLKKKIASFTDKLKQTLQGKAQEQREKLQAQKTDPQSGQIPAQKDAAAQETPQTTQITGAGGPEQESKKTVALEEEGQKSGRPESKTITPQEPVEAGKKPEIKIEARGKKQKKETTTLSQGKKETGTTVKAEIKIAGEEKEAIDKIKEMKVDEKRELRAKPGILTKITGLFAGKIKISEKETSEFFDEFELSLLESDVELDAAQAIVKELKARLVGKEVSANQDISALLKKEVKESLRTIMETKKIDLLALEKRPTKVLFLGPNGAGKTTSIAKIANYLKTNGKSVIFAAGDTFRAASIEQLETHANALGMKIVKHKYGSDPAAVAFDAVKAAQAKHIDYVLIDTAGRQETNRNLIEELKKIERVVKPDLKLYVGEAYTGQALLQQASEFDKAIGIDGFVLTKIDADTKGGTAISLLYALKKPIVFVGTGQRYSDLLEFRSEFIIDRII